MILTALLIVFSAIFGALAIGFVGFTLKIWLKRRRFRHIPMLPFPKKYPLKTNFWLMHLPWFADRNTMPELLDIDEQAYEASKAYMVYFLHVSIAVVHDIDIVKRVLVMHNKIPKNAALSKLLVTGQNFFSRGIFAIKDQKEWKINRAHLNPAFSKQNLTQYVEKFNAEAVNICRRLHKIYAARSVHDSAYSDYFSMLSVVSVTSFNSITQCGFGWKIKDVHEPLTEAEINAGNILPLEVHDLFLFCMDKLNVDFEKRFHKFMPWNWAERSENRKKAVKLRNFFRQKIQQKIKQLKLRSETSTNSDSHDDSENETKNIFEYICELASKGSDEERMIDEVITMIVGGYETTTVLISLSLMELSRRPDCLKRCLDEFDEIIGDSDYITIKMVQNLEYTNSFIKEIARVYGISPFLIRSYEPSSPNEVLDIGDYKIPSGGQIGFYFKEVHKFSFKNGRKFVGDRFLPESKFYDANRDILTFSHGPRNCIGRSFALLEAPILLVNMLRSFEFHSEMFQHQNDLDQHIPLRNSFVFSPRDKAMMRIKPKILN